MNNSRLYLFGIFLILFNPSICVYIPLDCVSDTCLPNDDQYANITFSKILHSAAVLKPRKTHRKVKFRKKIANLQNRINSLEQPVWSISQDPDRWHRACEGPCKCHPANNILSCWNNNLHAIPFEQIIPHDVKMLDLGINEIKTFQKDTFKGMTKLIELIIDLSIFITRKKYQRCTNCSFRKLRKTTFSAFKRVCTNLNIFSE